MPLPNDAVLLLAHGTVTDMSELPAFLTTVRRGRPAPASLVEEMRNRYETIGGSPLLRYTLEQAQGLSARLGCPVEVAMRLWKPQVETVLPRLVAAGVTRVCLLPLAPFSVDIYVEAAKTAATTHGFEEMQFVAVQPWGLEPEFVQAQASLIAEYLTAEAPTPPDQGETQAIVLTAHSLPMHVINQGDRYGEEATACSEAIQSRLGRRAHLAFQSQGADGGDWLGPDLKDVLEQIARSGTRRVVVAPFGFLSDHVETLYDLDIEAAHLCDRLGLSLTRVPALNTRPDFLDALATIAKRALTQ